LVLKLTGKLLAKTFLELGSASDGLKQTGNGSEPDDSFRRSIGDRRGAEKWQEVVGTQRVKGKVSQDHRP
jgi:hypothetical protein